MKSRQGMNENQKFVFSMKSRYTYLMVLTFVFCLVLHKEYDVLSSAGTVPIIGSLVRNSQILKRRQSSSSSKPQDIERCDSEIRRSTIEKYCQSINQDKLDFDKLSKKWEIFEDITYYMVVDDKHETIYCDVPKAASSTWMAFLLQESLPTFNKSIDWDEFPIHDPPAQKELGIRHLPGYQFEEVKYRLKNYFKFLVVRHPLERLVSAYNDKFMQTEFGYGLHYRPYILDHFRRGVTHHPMTFYVEQDEAIRQYVNQELDSIPEEYLDGRTTEDAVAYYWGYHQPIENGVEQYLVTFSEFLEFYLNVTEELQHDHHWQAAVELCRPCMFGYDFVGKLETLKDDSYAIIKHMNISKKIAHPYLSHVRNYRDGGSTTAPKNAHHGTNDANKLELKIIKAFKDIDTELMDRVLDMVHDDFSAFGYSWDRDNFVSTCTSKWHNHTCC